MQESILIHNLWIIRSKICKSFLDIIIAKQDYTLKGQFGKYSKANTVERKKWGNKNVWFPILAYVPQELEAYQRNRVLIQNSQL